jgi:hypothetical protein
MCNVFEKQLQAKHSERRGIRRKRLWLPKTAEKLKADDDDTPTAIHTINIAHVPVPDDIIA